MLEQINKNIVVVLCKLEIASPRILECHGIFTYSFSRRSFIGWSRSISMDAHFERHFGWIKPTVKNKGHLEASMVQAFLTFKIKHFFEYYFWSSVHYPRIGRNKIMR